MTASGVGAAVTSVGTVALGLVITIQRRLNHILAVHISGFAESHRDTAEALAATLSRKR